MAQHPLDHTQPAFWQMAWEQEAHILVLLAAVDGHECGAFWPVESGSCLFFDAGRQKMKVAKLDEVETSAWKAFRLSLEVSY